MGLNECIAPVPEGKVFLAQDGFGAILKQVSTPAVALVDGHGIAGQQLRHKPNIPWKDQKKETLKITPYPSSKVYVCKISNRE